MTASPRWKRALSLALAREPLPGSCLRKTGGGVARWVAQPGQPDRGASGEGRRAAQGGTLRDRFKDGGRPVNETQPKRGWPPLGFC